MIEFIFHFSSLRQFTLTLWNPIPGRSNQTQQQILFKASLPALGLNSYYFEKKTEVQNTKSNMKITQNEACLLQNQVREQEDFSIYSSKSISVSASSNP